MYKVNLEEVFSLPACRTEYQVGDSYCAWSKIACSALNTRYITTSPCYALYDMGEMNPEVERFFALIQRKVGTERFKEVININDEMKGKFSENHERALKLALQLAVESGLVEFSEEDLKLVRELTNVARSDARIPA